MTKRFSHCSALLLTVLMLFVLSAPAGAAPSLVQIDLLTVNDYHGALAESGKNPGAAKLAALLAAEKAKNPAGTLILSAGDMFQGSPDSNLLYGKTVVDVMNQIGFDAMALGNHEFDWGIQHLKARAEQAQFPLLAANLIDNKTGKLVDFAKPYVLLSKQGVRIAVIGITTPETAFKANPKVVGGFTFADPSETVNSLVPQLQREGADLIVVLSHIGGAVDEASGALTGEAAEFLQSTTAIDALITGHSHEAIATKVADIPVVQARYNGRAVGKITLVYSMTTRSVLISFASLIESNPSALPADAKVTAIFDKSKAEIGPLKNAALGKTLRPLTHDRKQFSLLGQWTTDVMRKAAGADIAFQNGGGLRAPIYPGTITMGHLYEVLPFDNTLVTAEMTGEQILAVLEYGIRNSQIGMLQFSGIKVKYDSAMPAGKKIAEAYLTDGRALESSGVYKVVTNDFMAAGGDGYSMFKQAKNVTDTCQPVRDVLADAVRNQATINFDGDDRLTEVWSIMGQQKPAA